MNTKNVKFWHRQIGKGMMTIAIDISNFESKGDLPYGIAFCSPEDQFCRATGRAVALTRLNSCLNSRADYARAYFGILSGYPNIEFRNIPDRIYWNLINSSYNCFPQWAKAKTFSSQTSEKLVN